MKRVKSGCILQTLVFLQKEDCGLSKALQLKYNREEIEKYKATLEKVKARIARLISQEKFSFHNIFQKKRGISLAENTSQFELVSTKTIPGLLACDDCLKSSKGVEL